MAVIVQKSITRFEQFALEARPPIEEALARYCDFGPGCPHRLGEAVRYSLLAPGKRLRPLLVLMSAAACGGDAGAAMPAACAVEMVHAYSLIHDDLPAMDNDDLRRGRPTNHKIFGEGLAILAGDALLTRAFEIVARDVRPPEVAAACCAALGHAAGAAALVGGQVDDLAAESRAAEWSREQNENIEQGQELAALESIHHRKTGAMFLVSLRLGALTAGAEAEQMSCLEEYGRRLGLAFQIADDLLDVDGDEKNVGKRVGKDANRGKLTFPGLLGIAESRRRAERLAAEACEALRPLGPAADALATLARYVVERNR
ncbi:MAG TPA: farnesyl diphosphate synthase [Pirellulales bacterium]|nr:farnesyl diphosphate synthase [Pirellulales bacterium]